MKAKLYRLILIILMATVLPLALAGCQLGAVTETPLPGQTPTVTSDAIVLLRLVTSTVLP